MAPMRAATISSLPEELLLAILCRLPPSERHQTAPTCRLWHQVVQRSRAGELVEVQGDHAALACFQAWLQSGGVQHVRRLQLSPGISGAAQRASSPQDRHQISGEMNAQLQSLMRLLESGGQLADLEFRPHFSMSLVSRSALPSGLRRLTLAPARTPTHVSIEQPLLSLSGLQYLRFGGRADVCFKPAAGLPSSLTHLVFSPLVPCIDGLQHGLSGLINLARLELGCHSGDVELEGLDVAALLPRLTRLELSLRQPMPAWLTQLGGSLRHLHVLSYEEADAAAIDGGLLAPLAQLTCLDLELDFSRRLQAAAGRRRPAPPRLPAL